MNGCCSTSSLRRELIIIWTCQFRHRYNQEKLDAAVSEIIGKLSRMPEFKSAVIASSGELMRAMIKWMRLKKDFDSHREN